MLHPISLPRTLDSEARDKIEHVTQAIVNRREGLLYHALRHLQGLHDDTAKVDEVIRRLDLSPHAKPVADAQLLSDYLAFDCPQSLLSRLVRIFWRLIGRTHHSAEEVAHQIAIGAFLLLGFEYTSIPGEHRGSLRRDPIGVTRKPINDRQESSANRSRHTPATLLLVLVARDLSGPIKPGHAVASEQLAELVSRSVRFCCSSELNANRQESLLDLSDTIDWSSEQYVYMRLKVDDGGSIVGQPTKFSLKNRLKQVAKPATVERVGKLERMGALSGFHF